MPRAVATPAQIPPACRSDLLTIDGRPVPVRLSGTTATAQALGALSVQGCGTATGGIALQAGAHEVQTQPGFPPGVDVNFDSVVLDSAAFGAALAPTASGRTAAANSGPSPVLHVVRSAATSAQVVVHAPTGPFWLVLGQSTNTGWHATTATGTDLGPPQLVDGYANGWLVTPKVAGHDMVISLEWRPQRLVWAALIVSATALVVCVLLACWPRRATRRHVGASPGGARVAFSGASGNGAAGSDDPDALALGSPLSSTGTRPRWWALAIAPVVAGGAAAALIVPAAGLPVAALTLVALALRHGRVLLAATCVALVVGVDVMVAVSQAHHHFAAEFGWPGHFETAGRVAWLAVTVLAADAVVEVARNRRLALAHRPADPEPRLGRLGGMARLGRITAGLVRRSPRGRHRRRT
jgi:hypothetical protein